MRGAKAAFSNNCCYLSSPPWCPEKRPRVLVLPSHLLSSNHCRNHPSRSGGALILSGGLSSTTVSARAAARPTGSIETLESQPSSSKQAYHFAWAWVRTPQRQVDAIMALRLQEPFPPLRQSGILNGSEDYQVETGFALKDSGCQLSCGSDECFGRSSSYSC
ncbi:hypothetical protein B0J14DRAFT_593773 [Halenospora varia]|nr:hypothetical protein B0J14DRAFT_593773 [Halenospora varia]